MNLRLSRTSRFSGGLVVALTACLVGLSSRAGAEGSYAQATYPPCFGAAARNPTHSCENPEPDLTVTPSPEEAPLIPNAPCEPIEPVINACAFGVPAASARGTVALVGDSHADQWRAALEVASQALGWRGISITRPSCPFTAAANHLSEPERSHCTQWTHGVIRWFLTHPEVSTVFVSDHLAAVRTARGEGERTAQVAGYTDAWNALPPSVKHIVVIRDTPYARYSTLACVQQAMANRKNGALVCALPRRRALRRDPEVLAADRLHSQRVQVINLTTFFCDARLCYPVVGGVLVYRDAGHVTRAFATTLGPFLLERVDRLSRSW
jgi:hypothetical protein